MNLSDIITKCYILALIIRDDGERLLLGDGIYEFKSSLQHFAPNIYQNDVVELQGTDGQLLAGQVRRSATQAFDGYIADGTIGKTNTEQSRQRFLGFFRKKHHYKVVYIMPDGTAIQRDRGYIVDAPAVQELYQRFPEYHIGLNFEDPNYYEYNEDGEGEEIPANTALISLANLLAGGLVWDNLGAVSQEKTWLDWENSDTVDGFYQYTNGLAGAPLEFTQLYGNATQETIAGKNLLLIAPGTHTSGGLTWVVTEDTITISGTAASTSSNGQFFTPPTPLEAGTYRLTIPETLPYRASIQAQEADSTNHGFVPVQAGQTTTPGTSTWTTARLRLAFAGWQAGDTINFSFPNRVMFSAGSEAEPYEPYCGGVASPNPDYPQAVNVVSGEQTVKITGKNILKPMPRTTTSGGVDYEWKANGDIIISNTATGTSWFRSDSDSLTQFDAYLQAGNYTFSVVGDTIGASVRLYDETGAYIANTQTSTSFTITEPTRVGLQIRIASGTTTNVVFQCQLELGSTATAYEPYKSQSQEINLGKNMWGGFTGTYTTTVGAITTWLEDGSITITGTATGAGWSDITNEALSNNRVLTLEAGTYNFVFESNCSRAQLVSVRADGTGEAAAVDISSSSGEQSFTLSETRCVFPRARFEAGSLNKTAKFMITIGSASATYAPYKTPIELAKIGNYTDGIYNDNGTWKIHKAIDKIVFDGSEGWAISLSGTDNYFYRYRYITGKHFIDGLTDWKSDRLSPAAVGQSTTDQGGFILSNGEVRIRYGAEMSAADWKTYLGTHSITIYYQLETPTDTEITESALIAQLSAILKTYQGINNIWLIPSSEPQGELSVHYATGSIDVGAGYEWEEGSGDNSNIVENPGIDRVNPIWKVPGPATNPTLTNITTGQTISWIGSVASGETLTVDLNNQTAELGGANVFSQLSGDWLALAPGANRLEYSATGATEGCTLEWNGVVG